MSFYRRLTYFIPLVPRFGTPFHLRPTDIQLIHDPALKHLQHYAQVGLQQLDGERIISDSDYPYFIAGFVTRMAISTIIFKELGITMTVLAAGMNRDIQNTWRLQDFRNRLQQAYDIENAQVPEKK